MAKAKSVKQTRTSGRSSSVYEFLAAHQNQQFTIDEVTEETGLSAEQVQSAFSYLRMKKGEDIRIILRGRVYRYYTNTESTAAQADRTEYFTDTPELPEKTSEKTTFELVGATRDGTLVIQDDLGVLYRAEAL